MDGVGLWRAANCLGGERRAGLRGLQRGASKSVGVIGVIARLGGEIVNGD